MRILLKPIAEADIAEAMAWYDSQSGGLGDDFLKEVEATLRRIERRPQAFRIAHGRFRRAALRRFPYTVYFLPENDELVVFSVWHQRRDPRRLKPRLGD